MHTETFKLSYWHYLTGNFLVEKIKKLYFLKSKYKNEKMPDLLFLWNWHYSTKGGLNESQK